MGGGATLSCRPSPSLAHQVLKAFRSNGGRGPPPRVHNECNPSSPFPVPYYTSRDCPTSSSRLHSSTAPPSVASDSFPNLYSSSLVLLDIRSHHNKISIERPMIPIERRSDTLNTSKRKPIIKLYEKVVFTRPTRYFPNTYSRS